MNIRHWSNAIEDAHKFIGFALLVGLLYIIVLAPWRLLRGDLKHHILAYLSAGLGLLFWATWLWSIHNILS